MRTRYVAVIGPADATTSQIAVASEVGRLLAESGATVVTGGLGGVMQAAARGAWEAGGLTVGLLPGEDRADANPYLAVALPTGLGEARDALVVRAADAVIAVGGGHGTLAEIALALKAGTPVVGLDTWDIDGVQPVGLPDEAVRLALTPSS
jgi:uncharacterized protein (TIGR00725 family)